jgi:uncharacterized protein (DUF2235 family)
MPETHAPAPRNIVLLSDGTGNSAAKLMKTNVWRMYEAVDLTAPDQLALYSNGVGTSSFKPLAVLGGGIGLGLKRNVLDLYKFACRNYVPASPGREADRLYAFGFSRGAFTIRVLASLIADQGLVTGVRGRELERQARWAYRAYRRKFNTTGGLVGPLRALRDWLWGGWERLRGLPAYDPSTNIRPEVRFLGLWDTVDAYGLPIDEMTRGWDQWVWPLSMSEPAAPDNVRKVCHAIAIDDERHTFHPLLLDERQQPEATHTDEERVTQVWFAGVHSNVGGGYPDDSLAHVSLRWMASEAQKQGLRLHPYRLSEWASRADPHGPIYDPRRGFGAYYRYNPRRIATLTRTPEATVARPKIHDSVFRRVLGGRDDYAPVVLPPRYAVVTDSGELVEQDNPYEHPTQAASRAAEQERVWNDIWKRRVVYFAMVLLTSALVLPPLIFTPEQGQLLGQRSRALSALVKALGSFLPGFLQPWVTYYQERPAQLAIGAVLLTALLLTSAGLQRAIGDRMRGLWDATILAPPRAVTPAALPTDLVYRLRTHPAYLAVVNTFAHTIFPFVFGLGALLVLVLVILGTANRAAFAVASASGQVCRATAERTPVSPGVWLVNDFDNRAVCFPTGIVVRAGERYRVTIDLSGTEWNDGGRYAVDTPAGFSTGRNPLVFGLALPFRRVLTAQWFVPLARIGETTAEYHPIDATAVEFTSRQPGQLFLFVNDAIAPWPFWASWYANNQANRPPAIGVRRLVN